MKSKFIETLDAFLSVFLGGAIMFFFVMLVGAAVAGKQVATVRVKVVRPDGVVCQEYTGEYTSHRWSPRVPEPRPGQWMTVVRLDERSVVAPAGWFLDVEEAGDE